MSVHENPRDGLLRCRQSGQEELDLGRILSLRLATTFSDVPWRIASHWDMFKLMGEWSVVVSVCKNLFTHLGTSVENYMVSSV